MRTSIGGFALSGYPLRQDRGIALLGTTPEGNPYITWATGPKVPQSNEPVARETPGAYFINTSRCEVVDQAALESALDERGLFAGLDVFDGEPSGGEGSYEGSLCSNRRVYCTHHIGASTEQAQEAVAMETVRSWEEHAEFGTQ